MNSLIDVVPRNADGSSLDPRDPPPGSSSIRHVVFNLAGQIAPLLVALATVPTTVALLGPDRFGLLALAITTLGISAIIDLSFARGVTRFCSEALARGDAEGPGRVVRSAVVLQLFVGFVFAGAVWLLAPLVLARGLSLPARALPEASLGFRILAASAIPNLVMGCFRGFLESHRRFDLVNLVRAPGAALSFLLPWVGARAGWSLTSIALALLLARFLMLAVMAGLSHRIDPKVLIGKASPLAALSLAKFSGYVTASDALPASLAVWDQFLLGAFASLGAVASFSVPNEIVVRLWVIPTSVIAAYFPVLASACARHDRGASARTIKRAGAGILILLGGPVLVLLVAGPRLLAWWMGAKFAASSAHVIQILAAGMLLGGVGLIATGYLQAAGRPDVTARLRVFLFPVWLLLQWKLTELWGLTGAATGLALRSGLDALLFLGILAVTFRRSRA